MQTACYNGQGGVLQNPSVLSSPVPFAPWWTVIGSARNHGELFGQLKPSNVDRPNEKGRTSEVTHAADQGTAIAFQEKGSSNLTKISIFPANLFVSCSSGRYDLLLDELRMLC